jgi:hypothetical protein
MKTGNLLFAMALLSCTACLMASPVGSIAGTVKDSSGALVPAVKLTLTNTQTNAHWNTVTNSGGEFQFPQLAPANYSLVAENSGFKRATVNSVLVQVDQVTHIDLALEVGNVTESVQVEAAAPLLEIRAR